MLDRIVISDASTLIGLQNIGSLHLLHELYDSVSITSIVQKEAGVSPPEWMIIDDDYNEMVYRSLVSRLDDGEASSIALTLARPGSLLIIDEKKGRRQAKELGLTITGLTGIIIRAKREGLIESGKAKLDDLLSQGFRLSRRIYAMALEQMGE